MQNQGDNTNLRIAGNESVNFRLTKEVGSQMIKAAGKLKVE